MPILSIFKQKQWAVTLPGAWQSPLYLQGADVVVLGEFWVCRFGRRSGGSTLGAMDAWLLQRGMRTLFLRFVLVALTGFGVWVLGF